MNFMRNNEDYILKTLFYFKNFSIVAIDSSNKFHISGDFFTMPKFSLYSLGFTSESG